MPTMDTDKTRQAVLQLGEQLRQRGERLGDFVLRKVGLEADHSFLPGTESDGAEMTSASASMM